VEIALIVKLDAGMTAKVLKLANSAAHGTLVEIHSIEQAAVKLGSEELSRLALAAGAHSFFAGLGSSTPRSNRSLWMESLTNAIAARLVAQERERESLDLHYTIGLLMNMGHVVLDRFLRAHRDDVLAKLDRGTKMLQAEKEVFGATHADVGARMAQRWGFPEVLVDAIGNHHSPSEARDHVLCADVNLAEALTWDSLQSDGERNLAYGPAGSSLRYAGLDAGELQTIRSALPGAVEAQRYLMALD